MKDFKNCTLYLFIVFNLTGFVHAQGKRGGQKLDNAISFEDLVKRKKQRTVSWSNPNGTFETLQFVEMAIPITKEAKELTTQFNLENYGINSPWLSPKIIVLHSMDLGSLQNSLEQSSFLNDEIPKGWGTLYKAGRLPNGSHFIIDTDGSVICLAPPLSADETAVDYTSSEHKWYIKRHQDGNPCAIGIENVTTANGDFTDLTPAQIVANAKLIRWLIQFEKSRIEWVTSHHQFNEENLLDAIHNRLQLNYKNKAYRTTSRKDIGNERLDEILKNVSAHGYQMLSPF